MKLAGLCVLAGIAVPLFAGVDKAPDWVTELSTRQIPSYGPEVHSVVLWRETHVTVQPDGKQLHQVREAVRILNREGQDAAVAEVEYAKRAKNVRDLHAWLCLPNGSVKDFAKDSVVDVGLQEEYELYNEMRAKVIRAQNPPDGSTFAWVAESVETSLTPDDMWAFQGHEPTLAGRYVLTLPPGWKYSANVLNHAPIEAESQGDTHTWELKNLGPIKHELQGPQIGALVPRLSVAYWPAEGKQPLKDWTAVSAWYSELARGQATTNSEMVGKVQALTAGAGSATAKAQAISAYVQKLKYVEIAINQEGGGGIQPHPADEVFAKQYGDCKDKANLMKAMLKIAGVESYLVTIYSGDRSHVRKDWISPWQFNHMIVAVRVPDGTTTGPLLKHPELGTLLFFDPTDAFTPFGDLPESEQGSYALLNAGARGDLVRVPELADESNRTDIAVNAAVDEHGSLAATVIVGARAQSARELRGMHSALQPDAFKKEMERWLARNVKRLDLQKLDATDDFAGDSFAMTLGFTAPQYAQTMQGRLLVFSPAIVRSFRAFPYQTEQRVHPLVLEAECYHKKAKIKLPTNFKIDEMPDPVSLETSFGTYRATYKLIGDELEFTEELDVASKTLPASRYNEAREFFEHVAGAEQAPLVLVRN